MLAVVLISIKAQYMFLEYTEEYGHHWATEMCPD